MAVNNLNTPGVGIQPSLIDAKGDLLVGTANDAIDRLGVTGTTGAVLTADAGETTGLKWAAAGSVGGLVHINTTSFSAVASQSINDVFSASYKSYKIICNFVSSVNAVMTLRLRVSGTDASGATDYRYANQGYNVSDGASPTNSAGTSSFRIVPVGSTARSSQELVFFNPFETINTTFTGTGFGVDTSLSVETSFRLGGRHAQNVSYTGFSVIASTGNITGQISIFGIRE